MFKGLNSHKLIFRSRLLVKCLSVLTIFSMIGAPVASYAQAINQLNLPVPGSMVPTSQSYAPVLLKGMTLNPDNPLEFDFIIDAGQSELDIDGVEVETEKLVKYFLAAMTVPKDDLWVNLSPYEKDRIIPDELGKTELGRDLLAQDYILKQLTSSLMYPYSELGEKFWARIGQVAKSEYGIEEVPSDLFNKVWILPESATVYEHGKTVVIVQSRLKVMLDSDYLALQEESGNYYNFPTVNNTASTSDGLTDSQRDIAEDVIRETILPEIEKEVNSGKNFAQLRQIYNALILAKWYKENIQSSLLSAVYADHNNTNGIAMEDDSIKNEIYERYMDAYEKGVFNLIKEDYDALSQTVINKKYFSGGFTEGNIQVGSTTNETLVAQSLGDRLYRSKINVGIRSNGVDINGADLARRSLQAQDRELEASTIDIALFLNEVADSSTLREDFLDIERAVKRADYDTAIDGYRRVLESIGPSAALADTSLTRIKSSVDDLEQEIKDRIRGTELARDFKEGIISDADVDQLNLTELSYMLRALPMDKFEMPRKFLFYSAAPGSGKGTVMDLTFDKKARFGDIVGQLLLYHTRDPRTGEINGKKYHFRGSDAIRILTAEGRITSAFVNKQLQGVANEEFIETVDLVPGNPSHKLLPGDVVRLVNGQEVEPTIIETEQDVLEPTVVERKIKGLSEAFANDKLTVLEGGYGWFSSLTQDDRYKDIFTVFISPFTDEQIELKGKNQTEINELFESPLSRLVAYMLLNKLNRQAGENGVENLDLASNQTYGFFPLKTARSQLISDVVEWEKKWAGQPSSYEMMKSLGRNSNDQIESLRANSELIESPQFIEELNRARQKYFDKEPIDPSQNDLARALAYEVQMKLSADVGRGDTSFNLEVPSVETEETANFTKSEDMFNRVIEGVNQIFDRNEYAQNEREGRGAIVINKFVYDKSKIEETVSNMANGFSEKYFRYLVKGMIDYYETNTQVFQQAESEASNINRPDEVGGIDLNNIDVNVQGSGLDFQFDSAIVEMFQNMPIDSVTPVIINIAPLPSVMPLLGLAPSKEEYELSGV